MRDRNAQDDGVAAAFAGRFAAFARSDGAKAAANGEFDGAIGLSGAAIAVKGPANAAFGGAFAIFVASVNTTRPADFTTGEAAPTRLRVQLGARCQIQDAHSNNKNSALEAAVPGYWGSTIGALSHDDLSALQVCNERLLSRDKLRHCLCLW